MWVELAKADEVARGGVKYVRSGDDEIALCNVGGAFHGVSRRCGHMNAPLEQGSLDGHILTCPLHFVQFDVTTGKALSYPIDHYFGEDVRPESMRRSFEVSQRLEWKIRVHDLRVYAVRVVDGAVQVDV